MADEIEALRRLIAERDLQLADERQRREAAELAIETRDQRIQTLEQLNAGTYYSTIDEVWDRVAVDYTRQHFDEMYRRSCPEVYQVTLEAAFNVRTDVVNEPQYSRTSDNDTARKVVLWPKDIFGQVDLGAPIAHLIPASSDHASIFDDVAAWVMGLTQANLRAHLPRPLQDPRNVLGYKAAVVVALQKAIHGARPKRFRWMPKSEKKFRRIRHSGLKHSVFNKIRLGEQGTYFDNHPCVLIVPVMDLEQAKAWDNGQAYSAIVMAAPWNDHAIENVCKGIGMLKLVPAEIVQEADNVQIELARTLLEQVLRGLAFSLFRPDRPASNLITRFRNMFSLVNGERKIFVPVSRGEGNVRVRLVRFGVDGYHPAPDPLLLAVKAGIVWSTRCQQQLLANGEVEDDDDDSLDRQAEEEYLERIEQSLRPTDHKDLAIGLGQPEGYRF